jgi:hypothetical protein
MLSDRRLATHVALKAFIVNSSTGFLDDPKEPASILQAIYRSRNLIKYKVFSHEVTIL